MDQAMGIVDPQKMNPDKPPNFIYVPRVHGSVLCAVV